MEVAWIIDATNWLHALWHGIGGGDIITPLVKRLEAIRAQFHPAVMHCAFDCGESFRHKIDIAYKANRPPKPEGLKRQLEAAPSAMPDWCMPLLEPGYEADDVLATVAAWARDAGWQCVLASGDKDVRQCLRTGGAVIARKFRRETECEVEWYTANDLMAEHGLRPDQWADFQTLAGDSTDTICGCPGIGAKTAAAMLQAAGSLDEALRNPWCCKLNTQQHAALVGWKPRAEHYRRLVRLEENVPGIRDAI